MGNVEVSVGINIYEKNGKEVTALELPKIIIQNHWNYGNRVVLIMPGDHTTYTVIAEDLLRAVRHASDSGR